MKFSIKKLLVSGLLVGAMTVCAGAADFEGTAQSLNDLGLLAGSESGFELDRAPSRAEASAMLVRLLGKENEAQELWTKQQAGFPFTDMEGTAWAKPYVSWLEKNGLAAGTGDGTTYAPSEKCSAQMYATFLLRALGYSDAAGGDFTYQTAMDFAREKGVVDLVNCDEKNFLRDDLAAMSYTALSVQPKSGEADLLSKLVAEGAVADNDASKAVREKFADYRDFVAANEAMGDETSVALKLNADIAMQVAGESMKITMAQDMTMALDPAKPEDMEMSMVGKIKMVSGGETIEMPNAMYFKDGTAYVEADGQKIKMPMGMEEALAQAEMINVDGVSGEPITAITDLKKTTASGKTTYEVTYDAKLLGGLAEAIQGSMMDEMLNLGDGSFDFSIDKLVIRETVDAKGALDSMSMDMVITMSAMGEKMTMDMKMDMDITATGSAVKVKFPSSFADYVDLESLAAAPDFSFSGAYEWKATAFSWTFSDLTFDYECFEAPYRFGTVLIQEDYISIMGFTCGSDEVVEGGKLVREPVGDYELQGGQTPQKKYSITEEDLTISDVLGVPVEDQYTVYDSDGKPTPHRFFVFGDRVWYANAPRTGASNLEWPIGIVELKESPAYSFAGAYQYKDTVFVGDVSGKTIDEALGAEDRAGTVTITDTGVSIRGFFPGWSEDHAKLVREPDDIYVFSGSTAKRVIKNDPSIGVLLEEKPSDQYTVYDKNGRPTDFHLYVFDEHVWLLHLKDEKNVDYVFELQVKK